MRKSKWKNAMKRMFAGVLLGCMLLTVAGASSDKGISPQAELGEKLLRL